MNCAHHHSIHRERRALRSFVRALLAPAIFAGFASASTAHAQTPAAAPEGTSAPVSELAPAAPTAAEAPPAPAAAAAPNATPAAPASASTGLSLAAATPVPADKAPTTAQARTWRYSATIGAVSLPRVLALDVMARFRRADDPRWDLFAVGIGIDDLPSGAAKFSDTGKLAWLAVGADARWFPWHWLYVGSRIGYQSAEVSSVKYGSSVKYTTDAFLLAPKVGALYTFSSGFTIGGELGATIPIGAQTTLTSDGTEDSASRKLSKTFGMFVMPFFSLRIGYTI